MLRVRLHAVFGELSTSKRTAVPMELQLHLVASKSATQVLPFVACPTQPCHLISESAATPAVALGEIRLLLAHHIACEASSPEHSRDEGHGR